MSTIFISSFVTFGASTGSVLHRASILNDNTTQQHTSSLQVLHESNLVYVIRFRCLRCVDTDVVLICVLNSSFFGTYVPDS